MAITRTYYYKNLICIKYKYFKAFIALDLIKLAGKISPYATEIFAFNLVDRDYNSFQEWATEKAMSEYDS